MLHGLLINLNHKYANEPWKNSKDSLTRAMVKDNKH